jgi:hypothetical protein
VPIKKYIHLEESSMDKILHITDRLESKKKKQQVETYRKRIDALRAIMQCSSCCFKCAMCGHQMGANSACGSAPVSSSQPDAHLCESCRIEFNDYIDMVNGKKEAEVFWHNREWLNLWSAWVAYQESIREFRNSPECKRLNTEKEP